MRTLVLGLGNELASDDGVGILAARALRGGLAGRADVVESAASGLALLDVLAGYDRAILLDAVRTGRRPPGTVVELGLDEIGPVLAPSTHQAGLPELAVIAERLGLVFPRRTVVLAMEVVDPFTLGGPLSPPVRRALPDLVRRTRAILDAWAREEASCTTSTPSGS
ncbi:MAG: membrane protein [Actinomycetota bacterium]|nr:MAG: membrane protein [Actinomycetota bacterium]